MTLQEKLIQTARAELGTKEANGGDDKYIKWYASWLSLASAWCAIFVSWCANQIGVLNKLIPKFCDCDEGVKWFDKRGQFKKTMAYGGKKYIPKPGDIIFFSSKHNIKDSTHVGIVIKEADGIVYTYEGNSGDMVRERHYDLDDKYILGYGIPLWPEAQEEIKVDTFKDWVKRLQKEIGAKVDGKPGPETLGKTPTLKRGSRNNVVGLVQERLIDLGYDLKQYGADKSFGKATEAAIKQYQKDVVGFNRPDGILDGGKTTWKALLKL